MSDELKNRAQRNRRLIFDAEAFVQYNVGLVSMARGRGDENLADAIRLYQLASTSNRELIMRMPKPLGSASGPAAAPGA